MGKLNDYETLMEKSSWSESECVLIPIEWFDTLLTARTKYLTLLNYLFNEADVRDGKLSAYMNMADILSALEPARVDCFVRGISE